MTKKQQGLNLGMTVCSSYKASGIDWADNKQTKAWTMDPSPETIELLATEDAEKALTGSKELYTT